MSIGLNGVEVVKTTSTLVFLLLPQDGKRAKQVSATGITHALNRGAATAAALVPAVARTARLADSRLRERATAGQERAFPCRPDWVWIAGFCKGACAVGAGADCAISREVQAFIIERT